MSSWKDTSLSWSLSEFWSEPSSVSLSVAYFPLSFIHVLFRLFSCFIHRFFFAFRFFFLFVFIMNRSIFRCLPMTMTMTHPNEVSTKCRLVLRTRMEEVVTSTKKSLLMLWEACRGRARDQFLLNDRWALTRIKGRVWIHEFTVLGPDWGLWLQMGHIQQRHIHWGSVHVTGWLFVVSNMFTVFKILSRSSCSCTGIRQKARIRNRSRSRCRCLHLRWSRLSRTSCSWSGIRQTARIRNRAWFLCRCFQQRCSRLSRSSCSCSGIRQTACTRNRSRFRNRCVGQRWTRLSRTPCSCTGIRLTACNRNRPQYRCRWFHRCWSRLSIFMFLGWSFALNNTVSGFRFQYTILCLCTCSVAATTSTT